MVRRAFPVDPAVLREMPVEEPEEVHSNDDKLSETLDLYGAIGCLNDDDKELVLRYFWRRETMSRIAQTLDPPLTRQAVSYRIKQVKKKLRASLTELRGEA